MEMYNGDLKNIERVYTYHVEHSSEETEVNKRLSEGWVILCIAPYEMIEDERKGIACTIAKLKDDDKAAQNSLSDIVKIETYDGTFDINRETVNKKLENGWILLGVPEYGNESGKGFYYVIGQAR